MTMTVVQDPPLAESIQAALELETSLQDGTLYPNHICSSCKDILLPFLNLQTIAVRHEKFLLKHQAKIKELGLNATRIMMDKKEEESEHQESDIDMEPLDNDCEDDEQKEELKNEQEDVASCKICGPSKLFKKTSLSNHIKHFHKDKDIDCEVPECKAKFKKKADMKKHVRHVHNNEKSLCVQCGDSFKDLNYHMKVFHDNIRHPCETCEKVFTTKQGLIFHMKNSHGDGKKEVCHICAVEVKHVRHHIKLKHSGEKSLCWREGCIKKHPQSHHKSQLSNLQVV